MAFLPFKLDAEFFAKNKSTVPIILLFIIAGFFTRSWVESSNTSRQDLINAGKQNTVQYNKDIDVCREENREKDSVINYLYQQLFIVNGVNERIKEKIDSTVNRKK